MKNYNYEKKWQMLLTPDIVQLLTQIHEFKGRQNMFVSQKADTLISLLEVAKIQSTEASNKIEGIYTSDERIKLLALDKTTPQTRDEQEIAGYRDVLATIHENHEFIPITPNMILQLHRDLYKFSGKGGGCYKNADNTITEIMSDGTSRIRFQPVPAFETPNAVDELCKAYSTAINDGNVNPLIITIMFVLDFLCIHPFNDGNGRMSRLLTLLMLYRCGYVVGQYISLEKIVEQSKETYYEVLQSSSIDWHEGECDYKPFVSYMLGVIVSAYRQFEESVSIIDVSKPERVAELIKQTLGQITKREIMNNFRDISDTTVQRTLNDLLKAGKIIKIGGGRYTKYVWNRGTL